MNIPQSLDVDISDLDIGDSFRAGDIDLDENLTLKTAEDQIIMSVTQAAKEEEPEVEEVDGEATEDGEETSSSEDSDSGADSADKGETQSEE